MAWGWGVRFLCRTQPERSQVDEMPLPEARMEQVALGRGVADRSCLLERPLERWELRRGPKNHLGRMPCWGYILL